VKTVKDALLYFFMAKIFLNYSPAVYNLLSDTPQSLSHTQWILEEIVRYFVLKKPFKGVTTNTQQRVRRIEACRVYDKSHNGPCKPRSTSTFRNPSKPKEQATELPTHEIEKKGFFTAQNNRARYELNIWYIDSAATVVRKTGPHLVSIM
jgi:hypothetical protein